MRRMCASAMQSLQRCSRTARHGAVFGSGRQPIGQLTHMRYVTSNASSDSELPQWGKFGKNSEIIEALEAVVRRIGAKQVEEKQKGTVLGMRAISVLTTPQAWFNAEVREAHRVESEAFFEHFKGAVFHMLDGCEYAYEAIAAEFCKEQPDFHSFVEDGALHPKLANFLQATTEKYKAAGMRPTVKTISVRPEVLMLSEQDVLYAIVAFRTREVTGSIPIDSESPPGNATAKASAAGSPDAAGERQSKSEASPAPAAAEDSAAPGVEPVVPGQSADGEAEGSSESAAHETTQLWVFEADLPTLSDYFKYMRAVVSARAAGTQEQLPDPPVSWRLRDINFSVEVPEFEEPPAFEDVARDALMHSMALSALFFACVFMARSVANHGPPAPPLSRGGPDFDSPPRRPAQGTTANRWGDTDDTESEHVEVGRA